MLFYGILAAAALMGFFGLGLLSTGLLAIAWALTRKPITDSFPEDHRHWVKRTALAGIAAHLTLIAILIVKISFVVSNHGEGWVSALIGHWLIDHTGEALISVWLTYRVIKGGLNLHASNPPAHTGQVSTTPEPSTQSQESRV